MSHGDGSIFKTVDNRGRKRWKVEVTIGYDKDGRRKRTRKTARSHSDAVRIRKELVRDRDELGMSFEKKTLDQFALWWIREVRARQVKPSTASDYEHRYRKTISPFLGRRTLGDISVADVVDWSQDLEDRYAPASVNGSLRVLKMVLRAATDMGYCRKNVAASVPGVPKRAKSSAQPKTWNESQVAFAVQSAEEHWFGPAVVLGVVLGMRKGEVIALKWSDVDLESNQLHIRRSRREVPIYGPDGAGHLQAVEGPPKTPSSVRSFPIPAEAASFLMRLSLASPAYPFDLDERYVVSKSSGESAMTNSVFKAGFEGFCRANSLPKIRFHELRHIAAKMAIQNGARIESVSQALGHSRIDTTKAIYAPSVQALNAEFAEANFGKLFGTS